MINSTTNISPILFWLLSCIRLTSKSFAITDLLFEFAKLRRCSLLDKIFFFADSTDVGKETNWTWPIINDLSACAVKPPFIFAILAALLDAAIIDGSSIAIGRTYSLPLITKFVAIPRGRISIPIAFSIILLASSKLNTDDGFCSTVISRLDKAAVFFKYIIFYFFF